MLRFENGVPSPIVPPDGNYPRGHSVSTLSSDESFITVVYGESLQMESGDINIARELIVLHLLCCCCFVTAMH